MKRKQDRIQPESPFLLKPDYDMRAAPYALEAVRAMRSVVGPNLWDVVRKNPKNFGESFDFRILDENVLFPTCRAAQEWIYAVFPEDSTYYTLAPDEEGNEWVGVVVDRGLDIVLDAAERDGLINEEDYMNAMNDRDMRARQWE